MGACEVRGVDALRGTDVCFGIERQDAAGSYPPIDIHGLRIEQLEVGDEMGSIVCGKRLAAGRSRSHCWLRSIGHGVVASRTAPFAGPVKSDIDTYYS